MNFISRSGATLMNGASPFRFGGCNCFWFGLNQDDTGVIRYPTQYEIDDAINTAKIMGFGVIRSHTMGINVGGPLTIFPTHASLTGNTPNTAAFNSIDYAVYKCGLAGIRLCIPLTDQNTYFYGSKSTFTTWNGIGDETQFYTNAQVIADFKAYISALLNRVNQFNSVAYKNDPTVLCWETGNELSNPFPPSAWTDSISTYIKGIAPSQLVLDGSYGVLSGNLTLTNVDIVGNHFYPPQISVATSDASASSSGNKAYLIGEVDSRPGIVAGAGSEALDTTTFANGTQSVSVTTTTTSANAFNVQLFQGGLSLLASTLYTVSFYAKSSVARTIQVALQKAVTPYTIYAQNNIDIGTTWQQYTFTFTMPATADSNAQIDFNLAGAIATTWIDLVSVTASGVTNIVLNPSFESATLPPWYFQVITQTPDSYASFAASIEGNTAISGDLFWSLLPHHDTNGYTPHGDGYSLYYPGQTANQQAEAETLRIHAYKMQGVNTEPAAPVLSQAPIITSSAHASTNNMLAWQGVAGAWIYSVQRSIVSANGPWTTVGNTYTDIQTPITDTVSGVGAWYRVAAINHDGSVGAYSSVVLVGMQPATNSSTIQAARIWQPGYIAGVPHDVFAAGQTVQIDTSTGQVVSITPFTE